MDFFQFIVGIAVALGIPTALTQFSLRRFEKRLDAREDKKAARQEEIIEEEKKREEDREKSTLLLIQGMNAAIALGEATAHAIRDGKINGEMTTALKYAQDVKHDQKNFLAEQAVRNLQN